MNARQTRFVQEFVKDPNATRAAIRAGYSADSAHNQGARLIKNDEILRAIQAEGTKIQERFELTAEDIAVNIHTIANDPEAPLRERLRAWELLGKYRAMFTDRQISTQEGPIHVSMPGIPDKPRGDSANS